MDEHNMSEQHLSEELLEQVTGGCQGCNNDRVSIRYHSVFQEVHSNLANSAYINDNDEKHEIYTNQVFFHMEKEEEARNRIAQRRATPGHVELPEPQRPPGRRWIM
jgi:hypothetical protein